MGGGGGWRLSQKPSMSLIFSSGSAVINTTVKEASLFYTVSGSMNHELPYGFWWQYQLQTSTRLALGHSVNHHGPSWQHRPQTSDVWTHKSIKTNLLRGATKRTNSQIHGNAEAIADHTPTLYPFGYPTMPSWARVRESKCTFLSGLSVPHVVHRPPKAGTPKLLAEWIPTTNIHMTFGGNIDYRHQCGL